MLVHNPSDAELARRNLGKVTEPFALGPHVVPNGARVLRVVEQRIMGGHGSGSLTQWQCQIQWQWSDEEFFSMATATPHPMQAEPVIPDRAKKAMFDVLTQGPKEWVRQQTAY